VIHLSFERGSDQQEDIKHAIREAGYEVFKVSLRGA
jgi:hypothetical protein